jgi:hypothetical protein
MNPQAWKHVGDIKNQKLIDKIVHFVGLCCIIVSQYTAQKNIKYI